MTIEQEIEEFIANVDQMKPEMKIIFTDMTEWLRHQQSIIKNQAEEIAALKQQLEDYEHGHNAEMEGMDESPC